MIAPAHAGSVPSESWVLSLSLAGRAPAFQVYFSDDPRGIQTSESTCELDVLREPDCFLQVYSQFYEPILNYLYRRTHNLELAQDLTSQTFLRALEDLKRGPRRLRVRPWLYRIATNLHCSDYRRSRYQLKNLPLVGWWFEQRSAVRPDGRLRRQSDAEQVRAALSGLPERHQVPLVLYYYEGFSYSEIAEVLGIRSKSVGSRIRRALDVMENRLRQEDIS